MTQTLSFTFNIAEVLTLTSAPPPNGLVGQAYSHQLSVSGGVAPYVWSITPNIGLSIDQTGLITGTPTTAGNVTVSVHDSGN